MAGWLPKKGDEVVVVGTLTHYNGEHGTIIEMLSDSRYRIQLKKTGIVIGAARQEIRQANELEVLAQEAPSLNDNTACGILLRDMERRAQVTGGIVGSTWREAATLLKTALRQDRG